MLAALREQYGYDGLETCAADGSCAAACPVAIDTGALVKVLRQSTHGPRAERAARGHRPPLRRAPSARRAPDCAPAVPPPGCSGTSG